jgi:CBS domain containing-hemolysin-like protein
MFPIQNRIEFRSFYFMDRFMIQWMIATFAAIVVQALFALFEMASVSFSKIRLQYYVSQGNRRAERLFYLLQRPSRLFGTTLIGINAALQIGSECSRRFYEALHLNPDWAPLSQVLLVVIFGELAPLFAARRHPEQVAMALVPLMSVVARLLTPFIWAFDQLSRGIRSLVRAPAEGFLHPSKDEIKTAFEERGEDHFQRLISSVFQLKSQRAAELMLPIAQVQALASTATVADVRRRLAVRYVPLLPIYHRSLNNIVAIADVRKLLRAHEQQKVLELARPPWFVTQDTSVLQILDQFRRNNQSVAVILDSSGVAVGILTLDLMIDAIFGPEEFGARDEEAAPIRLERTLEGSMSLPEFNRQFGAHLTSAQATTLSEFVIQHLGHSPVQGERVKIGGYEFTILSTTLRSVKTLSIRSLSDGSLG